MNMNKNYKFVVASPLDEEKFKTHSAFACLLAKFNGIDAHIVYNNKEGLPKVYNKFISEENRDKNLIFVHDDVLIEDIYIFEKLELAFSNYDIVGLAGSKECDLSSEITAWHLMSKRGSHVGEVAHSKDDSVWTTVFGPTPSRALLIDGLFIGVNVAKLLDTNTKFDENFEFHHYDISFCLRANQNKLKIGVYPIRVNHSGLGNSMNSEEWAKSHLKFKQLYCK